MIQFLARCRRGFFQNLPTSLQLQNEPVRCRSLSLVVGQKASITKTFTKEDVANFADISCDNNPLHLDSEYAKTTRFRKPIVHGVLTVGLLSAVLGTKLPGPGAVVMSYEIQHPKPLYVGESVTAEVELLEINNRKALFKLLCTTEGKERTVTTGFAKLLVP